MKIDEKLNLVVPVDCGEGESIYFHSMPILKDTFRRYHFAIAKTFNKIFANDMQITGPKIAAMTLEEISREMGNWEDKTDEKGRVIQVGLKNGLIEEIKRLTSVIALSEIGWDSLPVDDALNRGLISESQWDEALQHIVFFTLTSVMLPRGAAKDINSMACKLWETQLSSFGCTEYMNSLRALTVTAPGTLTASPAIC